MTETKIDMDVTPENIKINVNTIPKDKLEHELTNVYLPIKTRIKILERMCKLFDIIQMYEIINKQISLFNITSSTEIENLFYQICKNSSIIPTIKLDIALCLTQQSERYLESDEESDDESREKQNEQIKLEHEQRISRGFEALDFVCYDMSDIPMPRRIQALNKLMESEKHKNTAFAYFRELNRDTSINSEYKYKSTINLERNQNIPNVELVITRLLYDFLINCENEIYYRILAGQYILQLTKSEKDKKITEMLPQDIFSDIHQDTQKILLDMSENEQIEYNRRADAADILLRLGNDEYVKKSRHIINVVLQLDTSNQKSIYSNSQNVHSLGVEESVLDALEYLVQIELMQVNDSEQISLSYIITEINKMLAIEKENIFLKNANMSNISTTDTTKKCMYCCNQTTTVHHTDELVFCDDFCQKQYMRQEDIKFSLKRIGMDRALYSKLNLSLSRVMLHLWSYIEKHKDKIELKKRLLEELEEMSGTCSSGYLSRMINSVSGIGDFGIKISWKEQIMSNMCAKLNREIQKITDTDSVFRTDQNKRYKIISLWFNTGEGVKLRDKIKLEVEDVICPDKHSFAIMRDLNVSMDQIINRYMSTNPEEKYNKIIEDFADYVLEELTEDSSQPEYRINFLFFIGIKLPLIINELRTEFESHVSGDNLDLYLREGMSQYEQCY
jgi:hypothetical protein